MIYINIIKTFPLKLWIYIIRKYDEMFCIDLSQVFTHILNYILDGVVF